MKTKVWAHRGASGYLPENTLDSFAEAARMGAYGIELDVHFTKDRQVVVIHDTKIDRTSNGKGNVGDYTLEELNFFDFGYVFYGECRGIRIPTLDQVYALIAPTGLCVNVEIKDNDPAICADIVAIADKYGMTDRVIYSSFNHFQLDALKKVKTDAKVCPLYHFNMLEPWEYGRRMGAFAMHPDYTQVKLLPEYVKTAHDLGIAVNVWTVNKEEDMKDMYDADVDGIITNYPDVALKLL